MKEYYVYILGSETGVLYIGVTNNLSRRIYEHKNELIEGFSKKYGCKKLLYYENLTDIENCILREKQLKKRNRTKKLNLIKIKNPKLKDLSYEIGL